MPLLQNWVVLAALAGLASNAFNFLRRFVLRDKDDSTAYAWYFEFIRLLVFSAVVIFDWKLVVTKESLLLFILLGLTEILAVYWLMKMHVYSHLSISTIISRTRLIWVPVIGFFLIGEHLKFSEYLGILVLFTGLSITIAPRKLFVDRGAIYANLDALIIAFSIVITAMALPFASNSVVNVFTVLPSVILFPLIMKNSKRRIKTLFHTNIIAKTFAIMFNIISVYLFLIALRAGDASKVTAIYQSMMVFSVLAGIILLKEREDIGKKLIGMTVTLAGIIFMTIF